jgi:prenylcysteine oxidase / farnesylcysteine lyase
MVCLATEGAVSVRGGNWQIFEHMLRDGASAAHFDTVVEAIQLPSDEEKSFRVQFSSKSSEDNVAESTQPDFDTFDTVVLAAPYQFSDIKITPTPSNELETIPYVQLHVTLFTTSHRPSPKAFNQPADKSVPRVVLTTLQSNETYGARPDEGRVGAAGFFSLSILGLVQNPESGKQEYVYKIFSPTPVNMTTISHLFGLDDTQCISEETCSAISWIYRKIWHSYPYEYPRVTFGEIMPEKGLWYTSPIEAFISTMETSALAGKNVAKLIVDGFVKSSQEHLTVQDPDTVAGEPLGAQQRNMEL